MEKRSHFNLYAACISANIATFSVGNCFTWTSPVLPKLTVPNAVVQLSAEQASWLGSLLPVGAIIGPVLAGLLMDHAGRKWTLTAAVSLITLSWAVLLASHDLLLMYSARVLAGVGCGFVLSVVPIYVSEIAEDDLRGVVGTLFGVFHCSGFLLEYMFGPYVSYLHLLLVSLVAPLLFLLIFPACMPESPYLLLQKGKDEAALDSLRWLRKGVSSDDVERELKRIKKSMEKAPEKSGSVVDLFSSLAGRRGLLISCGLITFQNLSGMCVIIFYTESIFLMTGSSLSTSVSTIITSVVLVSVNTLAAPIVKRAGMKRMLVISAIGMSFFQCVLSVYFYLHQHHIDLSFLNWLPVICLVGFVTFYGVGFGPLPLAVMAEVVPPHVKAAGSTVTIVLNCTMMFLVTKFFLSTCTALGEYVSFGLFSACCACAAVFTVVFLPDTRGLSFDDIQDILSQ